MREDYREAFQAGLRRGLVFGAAFTVLMALLKYLSLHSEGYTITVSYIAIMVGGVLVFLVTFAVKTAYDLYHTPPPYRRFPRGD